jgi:uncharacterized damage-inducible protein DinB
LKQKPEAIGFRFFVVTGPVHAAFPQPFFVYLSIMEKKETLEVWLRGPLPEIPGLLQPVAHALLQAQEEMAALDKPFPTQLLWKKPSGLASVGFHLQHLSGVLDRLFTYARHESLTEIQLNYLRKEGQPPFPNCTFKDLMTDFNKQLELALEQLKNTDEGSLTQVCLVGRGQIRSTHLGLLFHAAEHTQRHLGQLLVTARFLTAQAELVP